MHIINRPVSILLALAIGSFLAVSEQALSSIVLDQPFWARAQSKPFLMYGMLVAIPFFALSIRSHSHAGAWVVAFILTLSVRGWWLAKGIAYQLSPDGSGADILGGLITLLAPFPIALIAVVLDSVLREDAERS